MKYSCCNVTEVDESGISFKQRINEYIFFLKNRDVRSRSVIRAINTDHIPDFDYIEMHQSL